MMLSKPRLITAVATLLLAVGCGRGAQVKKVSDNNQNSQTNNTSTNNTSTNNTSTNNVVTPVCGDGIEQAGEGCDDGNTLDGDGCSAQCRLESCGDGVVDAGEVCDDGNTIDGDGCASTCRSDETCGNGFVDSILGEVCDDGNEFSGDGCNATCTSNETCGNGTVDVDEGCDDGNTSGGDGCSATCQSEVCGNGIVDIGEACDDGNNFSGDGCNSSCTSDETCGNDILDSGEVCDDGNNANGDGCDSTCSSNETCGNNVVDIDEECDDGNVVSNDGCSSACELDCAVGLKLCSMQCYDTNLSEQHCGDCNMPCNSDQVCISGDCVEPMVGNCVVDTSVFPLTVSSSSAAYGQITFDTDCSLLLVHGDNDNVVKVNALTGVETNITANLNSSGSTLGVVRHPNGLIYVSTASDELFSVTDAGVVTLVANTTQELASMVIAPAGFGSYAGDIIAATRQGDIVAVNEVNGTLTTIYNGTSDFADLEFGPFGTLYAVRDGASSVHTISSTGTISSVGSASGSVDGIAVSPDGMTIYLPAAGTDTLYSMDASTGTTTNLGGFDFDNGYGVTGILTDANGNVLFGSGESSMTLLLYP